MRHNEHSPLLEGQRSTRARGWVDGARTWCSANASMLGLLFIPCLLGLIQAVQIPAEIDAIRSLSCAHYYHLHPDQIPPIPYDSESCMLPEVEQHFSTLATYVTFTVVLANFFGMLVYGRLFEAQQRRRLAAQGIFGLLVARIPFLILPLYQYPILAPPDVRSLNPAQMLGVFWACAILGGLSGTNELVILTVESFITDTKSPEMRSQLFRLTEVALLLGASIGPLLGSMSTWMFPHASNACIGYKECQNNTIVSGTRLLFNNAPYWLAFVFTWVALIWILFVFNFASVASTTKASRADSRRDSDVSMGPTTEWGASLGAFQRLVPIRRSRWSYDTRVLQFTFANMCVALSQEGPIVLMYVMGFVFRWGRDSVSLALTTLNTVRFANMVLALPHVLQGMASLSRKPEPISDLTPKQIDACLDAAKRLVPCEPGQGRSSAVPRECDTNMAQITPKQRALVCLWRAQIDLNVSRISFLFNVVAWLTIFAGVTCTKEWLVIVGTVTLALGSGAQFLLRSAACTICDYIVEQENRFSPPSPTRDTSTTKRVLPSGADSYLIISSTLLLPCLLVGLCVRNEIYAKTVSTNPGIFFVVVAAVNALALIALSWMPSATSTRV